MPVESELQRPVPVKDARMHRKVRVLHIITDLQTGGAEMMLFKLLTVLDPELFECRVVTLRPGGEIEKRMKLRGIAVESPGMNPGIPTPGAAFRLIRLVRKWRPDVVQGWMYHGNLAALLCTAFTSGKTRLIWNIRGTNTVLSKEKWPTRITLWLAAKLSGYPESIIYNSQVSAERLESVLAYPRASRKIIHNGFDAGLFRPDASAREKIRNELGVPRDGILIGLVGRFHPVKDHDGFLRAASIVVGKFPRVRFLLAGRGVVPEAVFFRERIKGSLEGKVMLLGERSDMPEIQASLDVACCSSLSENFPNALGEAMACGVPCVSTDVGECAMLLGGLGAISPPGDPDGLADALARMLVLEDVERKAIGAASRRRIEERFSLDSIASEYGSLYGESLEGIRTCAG